MQRSRTQIEPSTCGFAAAVWVLCVFAQPGAAVASSEDHRSAVANAQTSRLRIRRLSTVHDAIAKRPVILFAAGRPSSKTNGKKPAETDFQLAQQVMAFIGQHSGRTPQENLDIGVAVNGAHSLIKVVNHVTVTSQQLSLRETALSFGGLGLSPKHTESAYRRAAEALKQAGASHVVVGYPTTADSFRVLQEAKAVVAAGLMPIVCFADKRGERNADSFFASFIEKVKNQVTSRTEEILEAATGSEPPKMMLVYAPDWTHEPGSALTAKQVGHVHNQVRHETKAGEQGYKILYGGKVTAEIARDLMKKKYHVDGFFLTGAEMPSDSHAIIKETLIGCKRWIEDIDNVGS